jgi:hypothetical protein
MHTPSENAAGHWLKKLSRVLPSLAILEPVVSRQPHLIGKAERMLATMLDAMASGRSRSGLLLQVRAAGVG